VNEKRSANAPVVDGGAVSRSTRLVVHLVREAARGLAWSIRRQLVINIVFQFVEPLHTQDMNKTTANVQADISMRHSPSNFSARSLNCPHTGMQKRA
jgi:hypothetical protein